MTRLNLKLFLLLSILNQIVFAQEVAQYNYGLLKFNLPVDSANKLIANVPQNLLLLNNQLYLIPDGTGRVYRLNHTEDFNFKRLDATIYYGFTFGSHTFFYKDTLYSFGGYGYWNTNGQLRSYVPQKGEWELVPLNMEIPFHKSHTAPLLWLDDKEGKLWFGYSIDQKEGIKRNGTEFKSISDSVYVLDLNSKEIRIAGALNNSTKKLTTSTTTKHLASSPWGQLIYDSEQATIYLIDFKNNQQLTLSESKTKEIVRLIPLSGFLHFNDSTLIVQSGSNWLAGDFQSGDSIKLSRADFLNDSKSIYDNFLLPVISSAKSSAYLYLIISFFLGSLVTGAILYLVVIRPAKMKQSSNEKLLIAFDEREKEVISQIAKNSIKGDGTTVDQINQLIGVANKSLEIQKKQRSDIFLSINEKWGRANSGILIDKRRLEHDKRSYEYFIDQKNLNVANSLVKYTKPLNHKSIITSH